jgi:excisionase family DNA binding protein
MTIPILYTPEEVATQLKTTRRTVYRWLTAGTLRGLRAGDGWRISDQDVNAFLESRRKPPALRPSGDLICYGGGGTSAAYTSEVAAGLVRKIRQDADDLVRLRALQAKMLAAQKARLRVGPKHPDYRRWLKYFTRVGI